MIGSVMVHAQTNIDFRGSSVEPNHITLHINDRAGYDYIAIFLSEYTAEALVAEVQERLCEFRGKKAINEPTGDMQREVTA